MKFNKFKDREYEQVGQWRIYNDETMINSFRFGNNLNKGFKKAMYNRRIQIPFLVEPFEKKQKRRGNPNTYHLNDIDCRKHCKHFKNCIVYPFRPRKNGNVIACWNFEGEKINLQVCSECYAVRFIELPYKVIGLCNKCKNKPIDDTDNTIFFQNGSSITTYKNAKQKRLKELDNE